MLYRPFVHYYDRNPLYYEKNSRAMWKNVNVSKQEIGSKTHVGVCMACIVAFVRLRCLLPLSKSYRAKPDSRVLLSALISLSVKHGFYFGLAHAIHWKPRDF